MSRARLVVAVLGAVVVAVTGVSSASASGDGEAFGRTLRFVEHETNTTQLDLGAPGPSAGDQVLADNPLFNGADTAQVGTLVGSCVITSAASAVCDLVFRLDGGSITVNGVLDLRTFQLALAVTGGTGKYRDVRGEAHSQIGQDETRHTVVIG